MILLPGILLGTFDQDTNFACIAWQPDPASLQMCNYYLTNECFTGGNSPYLISSFHLFPPRFIGESPAASRHLVYQSKHKAIQGPYFHPARHLHWRPYSQQGVWASFRNLNSWKSCFRTPKDFGLEFLEMAISLDVFTLGWMHWHDVVSQGPWQLMFTCVCV